MTSSSNYADNMIATTTNVCIKILNCYSSANVNSAFSQPHSIRLVYWSPSEHQQWLLTSLIGVIISPSSSSSDSCLGKFFRLLTVSYRSSECSVITNIISYKGLAQLSIFGINKVLLYADVEQFGVQPEQVLFNYKGK